MDKSKFKKVLETLPKEQWFEISEILEYIENNVELSEEDLEIVEGKYLPRWNLIVRSVLNNYKKEGYVDHVYRIVRGQTSDVTLPAKYKFNSVQNKNVKLRDDKNRTKYFEAVMSLKKNKWYTLDEIFDYVESLDIIEDGERERSKPDNPMPIWKHHIHSLMGHLKLRGQAEHKKAIAKAKSPTGEKIPAMYMFIEE